MVQAGCDMTDLSVDDDQNRIERFGMSRDGRPPRRACNVLLALRICRTSHLNVRTSASISASLPGCTNPCVRSSRRLSGETGAAAPLERLLRRSTSGALAATGTTPEPSYKMRVTPLIQSLSVRVLGLYWLMTLYDQLLQLTFIVHLETTCIWLSCSLSTNVPHVEECGATGRSSVASQETERMMSAEHAELPATR